ncbi:hypothetical protein DAPPUDRAFT_245636 [Daphnia pulex]|uniref:Uncharacterized protein n=1 Tax=Daphnia pulex TaxID=6669 RepID=E9GNR0_DAPPU|nr:hypothetical protein DAPPUDRAFT_245636 [Daphnia pulex]|eukprot:EFX78911.1 hypothetical protein DAPPUDRAFT_245636 [Daphnia pulex]
MVLCRVSYLMTASSKCLVDKVLLILETADGFEVEDELSFSVYVSNTEEPSFLVKKKCDITEPHPTPSVENSPSDGAKEKEDTNLNSAIVADASRGMKQPGLIILGVDQFYLKLDEHAVKLGVGCVSEAMGYL